MTKQKKSNTTAIVVGVLVPVAVVALLASGGIYVYKKNPHLLNPYKKRYMAHLDNNYSRSFGDEPHTLLEDDQRRHGSGIELKMSQNLDE